MGLLATLRTLIRGDYGMDAGGTSGSIPTPVASPVGGFDNSSLVAEPNMATVSGSLDADRVYPASMSTGNAAAPFPAVHTQGTLMFNFNHTELELRDIIQALESKISGLQAHLQKLVTTANAQAQLKNAPAAPAVVAPATDAPAADPATPAA